MGVQMSISCIFNFSTILLGWWVGWIVLMTWPWELGCKVGGLPSHYLGLPLWPHFKSMAVWDGVEERFPKKASHVEKTVDLKGRRPTLIWSTLSSMPIYFMSLFCMPRQVRLRLEKI